MIDLPFSSSSRALVGCISASGVLLFSLVFGAGDPDALLGTLGIVVLFGLLSIATFFDLQAYRIPNWLTIGSFSIAVVGSLIVDLHAGLDAGLPASVAALSGGASCFFVMFIAFLASGCGAGDVKLAAAIGSLVGMQMGIQILCTTFIFAACIVISSIVIRVGAVGFLAFLMRSLLCFLVPFLFARPVPAQSVFWKERWPMAPFFVGGFVLCIF